MKGYRNINELQTTLNESKFCYDYNFSQNEILELPLR